MNLTAGEAEIVKILQQQNASGKVYIKYQCVISHEQPNNGQGTILTVTSLHMSVALITTCEMHGFPQKLPLRGIRLPGDNSAEFHH